MGAGWGIVDGGGCEQRVVATCDIAFVTSPYWDVFNCVAHPLILDTVVEDETHPLLGSVPLYVYPHDNANTSSIFSH